MCFHSDVTKYPVCLLFLSWNIRFFTASECFGSQLALKIKGIHTQLAFLLCLSLNSIHLPHPPFSFFPKPHPTYWSLIFFQALLEEICFTEKVQQPSVGVFPLYANSGIKTKLSFFPCLFTSLSSRAMRWNSPFPWVYTTTCKYFFSIAGDWCLSFVLISLSGPLAEAHPAPHHCGSGFWF